MGSGEWESNFLVSHSPLPIPLLSEGERGMTKRLIFAVTLFLLVVAGLYAPPFDFSSTKASPKNAKNVTFTRDVAPIFFKSCAVCHRSGEAAPFSVMTYKDVRPWAKSIREKVVNKEM